jgi:5-(carboxyamino)imidazole ribonucleotide synthase
VKKVGILGGGQLARMLVEAGKKLSQEKIGLDIAVFLSDPSEPAAHITRNYQIGSPSKLEDLRNFFKNLDVLIFENEFLDVPLLTKAAEGLKVEFFPSLKAIELTQDKLSQKKILNDLQIPTSIHHIVSSLSDVEKYFPAEAVLKWSRGGYDGKGTFFWKKNQSREKAEAFLKNSSSTIYAEEKISFVRELAIQVSHSVSGEIVFFPLVISEQRDGVCHLVKGPASALGVSPSLESAAKVYAEKIAKTVPIVGTFAIEFFETTDGKLLVNELAPRVHNSGHYTLSAANVSQFENHLRAVLGMPLQTVTTSPYFGMLNLLGPKHLASAKKSKLPSQPPKETLSLYWYEKSEIRSGRKMGHINFSAKSLDEMNESLKALETYEQDWIKTL